ncbi:HET domain-containing protein [Trichoderma sp. TUCIM 5745]
MAYNPCQECLNFVLIPDTGPKRHHTNLKELKACARSTTAKCRLCRLLWAAVEDQTSSNVQAQRYRHSWPANYVLALTAGTNNKLSLVACKLPALQAADTVGQLDIYMPDRKYQVPASFASSASSARKFIKPWLEHCISSHGRCGGKDATPRLPPRVIDISDAKNYKLLETTERHQAKYVALSYCWGEKIGSQSIHRLRLTRQNMKDMKKNVDQSLMTRTHREAIEVARALDFRYIWIDALCIVQGEKNKANSDWALQLNKVPGIYRDAELTLMAGRSHDSRQGFVNLADWHKPSKPVAVPYRQALHLPKSTIDVGLPMSSQWGPASARAWCYQESFLSRRIVIFAKQQLIFRCQTQIHCEDGHDGNYTGVLVGAIRGQIFDVWRDVVKEYSAKDIHDPFDCFGAFSGVSRTLQKALAQAKTGNNNPRYLAGLWETTNMAFELTWRSGQMDLPSGRVKRLFEHPFGDDKKTNRAPSWSWMAVKGSVAIPPLRDGYSVYEPCCSGAGPNGAWASKDWGLSKVTQDEIKDSLPFKLSVKGRLRRVRLGQVSARNYSHGSLGTSTEDSDGLMKYGIPLVDYTDNPSSTPPDIIALAIPDFSFDKNKKLYVLPTISRGGKPMEGLLLAGEKNARGEYDHRRLGICWIRRPGMFEKIKEQVVTIE